MTLETVCILDIETTGLDPQTDKCIEVAAVRYSLKHRAVIDATSRLFYSDDNSAENVNHIPAKLVRSVNNESSPWEMIDELVESPRVILAHNADFDRSFVPSFLLNYTWIDTCFSVDWPLQTKPGSSLIDLALAHGLAVVDPHRALSDCLLLARLLTRVAELGHDVSALLERGLRPTAEYKALVSFEKKDLAKHAGFQWDTKRRIWHRRMAIEDATREKLGFDVMRLEP